MFIFGGFTLVANSAVHLGQVEAFAPGEIVRFGNIEYTTDYCGELIITGGVSPDLGADSLDLDVRSNLGVIGGCRFFLPTHMLTQPRWADLQVKSLTNYREICICGKKTRGVDTGQTEVRGGAGRS